MRGTMVALGNATADGSVIITKNSDREPKKAHQILILPAPLEIQPRLERL